MVNVFAAAPNTEFFGTFLDRLRAHPSIQVLGVGTTGRETLEAVRTNSVDALIFAEDYIDLARAVRLSAPLPTDGQPAMIMAASSLTDTTIVRSAFYGFEGVVALDDQPEVALRRITSAVDGTNRTADESVVKDLGVPFGLLVRDFITNDECDIEVVDLVGIGLDDRAISGILSITIQEVRNRIESLLTLNGLTSRTHLAVIRAGRVIVPDLAG